MSLAAAMATKSGAAVTVADAGAALEGAALSEGGTEPALADDAALEAAVASLCVVVSAVL